MTETLCDLIKARFAEDTKLGREVAIKVLPDAFTADPERLARFEREARLLASFNHPRIAGIYGSSSRRGDSQPGGVAQLSAPGG